MKRGLRLKLALLLLAFLLLAAAFVSADAGKAFVLKVEAGSASNAYLGLGEFLYKAGLRHGAEAAYLKSVQLGDNAVARHNLGIIYYDFDELGRAAEQFKKALSLEPDYARARNSLAVLLFQQNDLAGAAEHFRELARLEPENAQAHFDLGVSLASNVRDGQGTYDDLVEAYSEFRAASLLDPSYPNAASNAEVIGSMLAVQ